MDLTPPLECLVPLFISPCYNAYMLRFLRFEVFIFFCCTFKFRNFDCFLMFVNDLYLLYIIVLPLNKLLPVWLVRIRTSRLCFVCVFISVCYMIQHLCMLQFLWLSEFLHLLLCVSSFMTVLVLHRFVINHILNFNPNTLDCFMTECSHGCSRRFRLEASPYSPGMAGRRAATTHCLP